MKNQPLKTALPAVLLCLGLSLAQENYSAWPYYKDVTVNTTSTGANVPGNVTRFPLLVRLTPTNADVFAEAAANGVDIRFTKPDGVTRLPHQCERWDAVNHVAEFWVLVDAVAGNATTTVRMYWGNSGAPDSSNGGEVFDTANGFRSVWHMGDSPGVTPRPNAVTPYSNMTATPVNFPDGYTPIKGVIGLADTFDGAGTSKTLMGSYMKVDSGTATTAYDFPGGLMTASYWAYLPTVNANRTHFQLSGGAYQVDVDSPTVIPTNNIQGLANSASYLFRYNTTSTTYRMTTAQALGLITNTWKHITVVYSRGISLGALTDSCIMYVNGVEVGARQTNTTLLPVIDRDFVFLGHGFDNSAYASFQGIMDEFEFSNARRSPDWIKLSYETQNPAQTVVLLGTTNVEKPGAPVGVSAVSGGGQATVNWFAPISVGGSAITAYTVTSSPDGKTCATTGALTCIVTGLSGGASYTFTVTATNAAGMSPASPPSVAVIPTAPAGVPDAPTGVVATGSNGQATVSWTAPSSNGGSAITGYTATSNPDGKTCATTGALTCTVTGLTNGVDYTFSVTATNSAGTSAISLPSGSLSSSGILGFSAQNSFGIHRTGSSVLFSLPATASGARISVMDIWGREVWQRTTETGARMVSWEGKSSDGQALAAGIYMVRVTMLNNQKKSADVWQRNFALMH